MHLKSDISSCWFIPANRVLPISNKTKNGQRCQCDRKPTTLEKQNHPTTIKRYISIKYFSRSNGNDLFVQSITNNDVLANSIRHQLGAYVTPSNHLIQGKFRKSIVICCSHFSGSSLQTIYGHLLAQTSYSQFNHFSNTCQTGSADSIELLKCCKEFSFQYNGLMHCRACVCSEAYTVLFARKGSHFSHGTPRHRVFNQQIQNYYSRGNKFISIV